MRKCLRRIRKYQLFGFYEDTGQRWSDIVKARSALEAEETVTPEGTSLRVVAVIELPKSKPEGFKCVDPFPFVTGYEDDL